VGSVVAIDIGGIHVPDNRTVFLATLAVHIAAGGTAVAAGALAATARKRPGRHPRAGTVYVCALAGVFATATVLAALRWRHDWHLFVIAVAAFALGSTGWLARTAPLAPVADLARHRHGGFLHHPAHRLLC
jgi:hypothetical protein